MGKCSEGISVGKNFELVAVCGVQLVFDGEVLGERDVAGMEFGDDAVIGLFNDFEWVLVAKSLESSHRVL